MNYKQIIEKTLQNALTTHVKIHKLDEHVVMEIFYDSIVDAIVADLDDSGYTIIDKQQ
jgi:hypothetical protein